MSCYVVAVIGKSTPELVLYRTPLNPSTKIGSIIDAWKWLRHLGSNQTHLINSQAVSPGLVYRNKMEGRVGFEPTRVRLTNECSTAELTTHGPHGSIRTSDLGGVGTLF